MANQGGRQDFLWRPNDESSTTRLRYDLESDHWYRSFKSAEMKHKKASISETLGIIGLVISLVSSLLILVILSGKELIKWLRSL
jgi:hypothetical protein